MDASPLEDFVKTLTIYIDFFYNFVFKGICLPDRKSIMNQYSSMNIPKLLRKSGVLVLLGASFLVSNTGLALSVDVDPGPVGTTSSNPIYGPISFVDDLDITFDHMKHVEVVSYGVIVDFLQLPAFDGGFFGIGMWLTDEFHNQIPGTEIFSNFGIGTTTTDLSLTANLGSPVIAHDVHFTFDFVPSAQVLTADQVQLTFYADGLIGEWGVPEPADYALMTAGLGLLGLAVWRRRRLEAVLSASVRQQSTAVFLIKVSFNGDLFLFH